MTGCVGFIQCDFLRINCSLYGLIFLSLRINFLRIDFLRITVLLSTMLFITIFTTICGNIFVIFPTTVSKSKTLGYGIWGGGIGPFKFSKFSKVSRCGIQKFGSTPHPVSVANKDKYDVYLNFIGYSLQKTYNPAGEWHAGWGEPNQKSFPQNFHRIISEPTKPTPEKKTRSEKVRF